MEVEDIWIELEARKKFQISNVQLVDLESTFIDVFDKQNRNYSNIRWIRYSVHGKYVRGYYTLFKYTRLGSWVYSMKNIMNDSWLIGIS